MFSHLTIGSNNVSKAVEFYDVVLSVLNIKRGFGNPEEGYCSYQHPNKESVLWVLKPLDGQAATVGNGTTVGFSAQNRREVDEFHATAMTLGATNEGSPGLRPQYHEHCYAAYVRDLDGNKLCCICHLPE